MQEHRVTIQGRTYKLEEPFYVFATQNPIELEGTYRLPEAQLDRFMFISSSIIRQRMKNSRSSGRRPAIIDPHFERTVTGEDLIAFQRLVRRVPVAEPVMRYALNIVRTEPPEVAVLPGERQEVGRLWRQRACGAVSRSWCQGASVDEAAAIT
jgi:MoxR-like ATPase